MNIEALRKALESSNIDQEAGAEIDEILEWREKTEPSEQEIE
jgi:hypothetical protein